MTSPLNLAIYDRLHPVTPRGRGSDPSSLVTLREGAASLSLLGKGLSARHLHAKSLDHAPPHLANPRRPFPFSNGREIYLPETLDVFPRREDNWRVMRLYAAVQAEQWECGTFHRPASFPAPGTAEGGSGEDDDPLAWIHYFLSSFPSPPLAAEVFFTVETARVAWSAARRFRGLAGDLAWFLPRLRDLSEPHGWQGFLWELFFHLLAPRAEELLALFQCSPEAGNRLAATVRPGATLRESMHATTVLYRTLVQLFGTRISSHIPPFVPSADYYSPPPRKTAGGSERGGRERKEGGTRLLPRQVEGLLEIDFRPLTRPLASGETVTPGHLGKKTEGGDDKARDGDMMRGRGTEGDTGAEGAEEGRWLYPEWDYLAGGYRRGWTTLYQLRAEEGSEGEARRLLEGREELVREVRRQFLMLRFQEKSWRKRLEWGEEIDIIQAVEREVQLRCGLPPTDKVYMEKRRTGREVSALILLDLSASTSSPVEEDGRKGETVLHVLVSSVAVLSRALEQIGDRFSIYGFSGYGRKRVEFVRVKSFDEPMDHRAWRRLGGLKPRKSTRMGSAVRHAHRLLEAEPSTLKLLLLLSDGYPQDFDYGEDRLDREYGLQDTARSLREAEAGRIVTFCVTVDAAGHDYLRRMLPIHRYLVLKSVEDLPSELPKVYLRLRGT